MRKWLFLGILLSLALPLSADMEEGIAAYGKRDFATARKIFERLASVGNREANYHLGVMYRHGEGVQKNLEKAYGHFSIATKAFHFNAILSLAWMFERGEGIKTDPAQAWYHFQLANEINKTFADPETRKLNAGEIEFGLEETEKRVSPDEKKALLKQLETWKEGFRKKLWKRSIYFKLPLESVRFHFVFDDRKAFLASSLKIFLRRGTKTIEIPVFDNGTLINGWLPIGADKENRRQNRIYFGFASEKKFEISRLDEVTIHLALLQDVSGAESNGLARTLKSGFYTAKGHFEFYDQDQDLIFISDKTWSDTWKLK